MFSVCTEREMDAMGRRLLDWFQLMMEDEEAHHVQKHAARINNLRGSGNNIVGEKYQKRVL